VISRTVGALLLLAALSCGSSGKKPVVVYSAHGRDILIQFERAFEEANPDVDVSTVYMGAQEIAERIRAERGNPQAAVWWGGDSTSMDAAAKEGLLLPYAPSYAAPGLPRHPDDLWTGCFLLPIVVGYHPARVFRADLPRRFSDLADPRFRRRILLREPAPSGTLRTFIGCMIARSIRDTGAEDAGFALLRGIDANVLRYEGSAEILWENLENGPGALTIWNLTDLVFQNSRKGFTFLPAGLDEPVPVIVDGIALVKGPPGEAAEARRFYEFVNSLDALALLARDHGRIPVRPDFDRALLAPEIRAVPFEPLEVDRQLLNEKTPAWMRRFEEEIRGRK
jgi:iron(III) transport system substrate-binding protein